MVDIIQNSQVVIGHGAFSIVYKARLKTVSSDEWQKKPWSRQFEARSQKDF
jgi:hypothetical protein